MTEQSKDDAPSIITQIVSEESGVVTRDITRKATFAQGLNIDSLGLLIIAIQVEERFGVTLDDSLIPILLTVGMLAGLVTSKKA